MLNPIESKANTYLSRPVHCECYTRNCPHKDAFTHSGSINAMHKNRVYATAAQAQLSLPPASPHLPKYLVRITVSLSPPPQSKYTRSGHSLFLSSPPLSKIYPDHSFSIPPSKIQPDPPSLSKYTRVSQISKRECCINFLTFQKLNQCSPFKEENNFPSLVREKVNLQITHDSLVQSALLLN